MIIIEGCDGTGKSTLAKELSEKLNLTYFKDNYHEEGVERYINLSRNLSDNTICDRLHLGEYVYPTVKSDGRKPITIEQQHMIERSLMLNPHLLILCDTTSKDIKDVFDNRGEDFISKNDVKDVRNLFNEAYSRSILNKVRYNYNTDDIDKIISKYSDIRCKYIHWLVDGLIFKFESIGNVYSPIMLVGDRYGDGTFIGDNKRAFLYNGNSSTYLHKALSLTKNPKEYYITNAYKSENDDLNVQYLKEEIELLEPKKIISLGKLPEKILNKVGVKFQPCYHPQYWKRFKNKYIQEYANLLV